MFREAMIFYANVLIFIMNWKLSILENVSYLWKYLSIEIKNSKQMTWTKYMFKFVYVVVPRMMPKNNTFYANPAVNPTERVQKKVIA